MVLRKDYFGIDYFSLLLFRNSKFIIIFGNYNNYSFYEVRNEEDYEYFIFIVKTLFNEWCII